MLLSLFLIALIAIAGLPITYLLEEEETLLWRAAAGTVIGTAVFGTIVFVLSMLFGLSVGAWAAFPIALVPVVLLWRKDFGRHFKREWRRAKDRLQGANRSRALRFAYYLLFLILFLTFFGRAMIEMPQGIYTGGSQNLGDLPFHLGAIFSFTEINNFPPQNPSFAGARFSYPFVADLVTAAFVKAGAGVRDAMLVQNVAWAFSLLIVAERFAQKLVNDRLAAKLVPMLLFFSGGLGFLWFFGDYWAQGKGFFDFVSSLPKDYTISDEFRWGNSLVTLFMTQRGLLLGLPFTIVILQQLWAIFSGQNETARGDRHALVTGLLAGLLPLVHLHSLAVLFVVGVFAILVRTAQWRPLLIFAAGVSAFAVPELLWSMAGSASETSKFFEWHFGWDKGDDNFIWFWIKNTGIFFAVLAAGLWIAYSRGAKETVADERPEKSKLAAVTPSHDWNSAVLFYLPFIFLFIVSNTAKLAPWQWDNIKVLIYWFAASLPFAALAISDLWKGGTGLKAAAAICIAVLVLSGSIDVWRTVSGQVNYQVFNSAAVEIAARIRSRTETSAMILNAPTYNSAVVLSGRQSLMRYPGHLSSHGIDYAEREADVKQIYSGGPGALGLLRKYGVDYVLVSPEEQSLVQVNTEFFRQFRAIAEAGPYKVYKIE